MTKTIIYSVYTSPCGQLTLGALDGKLCLCDWNVDERRSVVDRHLCRSLGATMVEGRCDILDQAALQLDEYFAGQRHEFDLPLIICGTELQSDVWCALTDITYGETRTYSEIAAEIGRPKAVRAVAAAIGANPMSIFIPCHRVIGKNGTLTGYAGGIEAKQCLLALEVNQATPTHSCNLS